jgi:hypothetical protein
MEQQQLDELKAWFNAHVANCYGQDGYVNANLKLKEDHSRRTCGEMVYIVNELGLGDGDRCLGEAIGLLHDIGRFKQFLKYRTYNDPRSVDHGLLGVEVLRKANLLDSLDAEERRLIEKSVEYHGVKELSPGLDERCLLFSRLIRDADKLDVFHTAIGYYTDYEAAPDGYCLELEFPNDPTCSPGVVEAVLGERLIDYCELRTWNDAKLLQLGWVYDVYFVATLKRIRERRFLEQIIEFLPRTGEVAEVAEKVLSYVEARIEKNA